MAEPDELGWGLLEILKDWIGKREILFTPHPFLSTPHIYYIPIFYQIQNGVYREIDGCK